MGAFFSFGAVVSCGHFPRVCDVLSACRTTDDGLKFMKLVNGPPPPPTFDFNRLESQSNSVSFKISSSRHVPDLKPIEAKN